jgi:cytochrome c peroxidase
VAGICVSGIAAAISSCGGGGGSVSSTTGTTGSPPPAITTKAELGKALFSDTSLSTPAGQSCGTCHSEAKDFTDPRPGPTSEGVIPGLFGFRHSPSIRYMAYSPTFVGDGGQAGSAIGGQFWDGRAPTLTAQIPVPILNPTEMNNASTAAVVAAVQAGPYAKPLENLYGASIFSNPTSAFNAIDDAIVQFEHTSEFSPFTSKYDAFLAGTVQLTASETRGLAVFNGQGGCAGCHTSSPSLDGTPPLFTNFCYANLGLPKNPNNPYYTIPAKYNPLGANFVDIGLQTTTGNPGDRGMFMTQSLRNVAVRGPYFHNGIFTTLQQVINFYNTRDLGGFPTPEVPQTEDLTELGNLGLTQQNISDVIAFLNTLTDGYTPTPAIRY